MSRRLDRLAPRHRATCALVAAWIVFFAPWLIDVDGIPYFRDLSRLYIPVRYFLHDSLRAGRLPQWFPYELLGAPFIGQIVTATFHPATWLLLPFSPLTAIKLNVMGAYLVGGVGGYRFARALPASRPAAILGSFALAFSGYAASMHNNLPYLMGLMTPLGGVGWRALRLAEHARGRDAALLAICWALVLLGGDIQGFGFAGVLVMAALLARASTPRAIGWALVAGGLALSITAIELLPATAVFHDTFRLVTNAGGAAERIWALHP